MRTARRGKPLRRMLPVFLVVVLLFGSACAPRRAEPASPAAASVTPVSFSPTSTAPPPAPTGTPLPTKTPSPTQIPPSPTAPPQKSDAFRFAVIGDYGDGGEGEAAVAALTASWDVDFIVTAGDNNYPLGAAATIDAHIGQFYHAYIAPYQGEYGAGAEVNRFFPVPGNHDWDTGTLQPYTDYFALPGNERYYTFTWGAAAFYMLDSDSREPDGVGRSSAQALWLRDALAASRSPWNIVVMHHPPYSSGRHGDNAYMQWPFAAWGADIVIAGHDHVYERILRDGIAYFINGLGGIHRYGFGAPVEGSRARYNADYGAMLVEGDAEHIRVQFINTRGEVMDDWEAEIGK